MSWALNNHWFVNFKAQQDGQIRLRYSLTSMSGHLDVDRAMRFAAEMRTPPVVLRDRAPLATQSGAFLEVLEGADIVAGSKVSEDGTGIVVRLLNFKRQAQRVTIDLGRPLSGAWAVLPDERERAALETEGPRLTTVVGPRCGESILLKWGP
jgi:alpha-mannosidase